MNNIISYINLNPIPFILMIVIMLFIIYKIYSMQICHNDTNNENFNPTTGDTVPNPVLPQTPTPLVAPPAIVMSPYLIMNQLNDQFVSTQINKQLVRFKYVSPENKIYYMAIMPLNTCADASGCISNVLILMDESAVNINNANYLAAVQKQIKVCNYNKELLINPNAISTSETFPECNISPQYQTDFVVTKMVVGNDIKYHIQGSIPNNDLSKASATFYVNKQKSLNNICVDTNTITTNNPYIGIDLITTQVCDNSGNKKLSTKIRFNITENDVNGNIVNNIMYVGKSTSTCNNFIRLTLYSDELDMNVITFEPIKVF